MPSYLVKPRKYVKFRIRIVNNNSCAVQRISIIYFAPRKSFNLRRFCRHETQRIYLICIVDNNICAVQCHCYWKAVINLQVKRNKDTSSNPFLVKIWLFVKRPNFSEVMPYPNASEREPMAQFHQRRQKANGSKS